MAGVLQNVNIPQAETKRKGAGFTRVGIWGFHGGDPQDNWSFEIKEGHRLHSIRVGHGDDEILSLGFTTEYRGALSLSNIYGPDGGETTLVTFDSDEELVGIQASSRILGRGTVISSLSFQTNKNTHGPFGRIAGPVFSLPWNNGSLVGFYGKYSILGGLIEDIGVHLKPYWEIVNVGTWGALWNRPQTLWSFQLDRNERLDVITIIRKDGIESLRFNTSEKVDDRSGGGVYIADNVVLDADEEIIGISGTIGAYPTRQVVLSSISFKTNKKTHGPFGDVKGDPFTVSWDDGSFAGLYGLQGSYINTIGVYLRASN
ncbi:mannose/glucose-specific lectin-like [Bidens hawaiensis]|uniref:mannose/glucose-specific lectin-like n=1 Tax=Bidens hawaiensis TaxID=980011 RepID=UPI00404B2F2F